MLAAVPLDSDDETSDPFLMSDTAWREERPLVTASELKLSFDNEVLAPRSATWQASPCASKLKQTWPRERRKSKRTIPDDAQLAASNDMDAWVADSSYLPCPCPCLSFNVETETLRAAASGRQAAVVLTVFAIRIRFAERDRCKVFCSIPLPWLPAPPSWLKGDFSLEQSNSGLLTSSDEVVSSDAR